MTHHEAERPEVASQSNASQANPRINVTPLVDVLLVVLIIFLVLTPLKPARFMAAVPSKPDLDRPLIANDGTLLVTIKSDRSLMLNSLTDMGSVNDTSKLSATLSDLFQQRLKNHAYSDRLRDRIDLPEAMRIEKTVFIKAPRSIPYGEVVRVLDGIRGAGASPVGLQIDYLN
jgi:biopolymer transport protein ExbD